MKSLLSKVSLLGLILILSVPHLSHAGGNRHGSCNSASSIGVRAGWSGGLYGLTYRAALSGSDSGIELTAGYSPKEGRLSGLPAHQRGNVLISARYQPMFMMSNYDMGVGFYASFGLTARLHLNRVPGSERGSFITPDLLGGGGIQVEFNDAVEIFADVHLKYYNRFTNQNQMSYESGLGIRFKLN